MDTSLISVIIPVYNSELHIARCLDSIVNQSYKNIEIIVINDASTDTSEDIIISYEKKYKVKCFKLEKNSGPGVARNHGIENSTGEYIGFVDSDDWIDTNFYMKLMEKMQETELDIIVAGILNECKGGGVSQYRYKYSYDNIINSDFALKLLTKSIHQDIYITPIVNNKLYKKKLISDNSIKFLPQYSCEDDIFTFLALKNSCKIGIVKDVFYHYYQRENSITHRLSKKHVDEFVSAFTYLFDKKKENKLDPIIMKFVERHITFFVDQSFCLKWDINEQRHFLSYLFEKVLTLYSLEEIMKEIDLEKVKRCFLGNYRD